MVYLLLFFSIHFGPDTVMLILAAFVMHLALSKAEDVCNTCVKVNTTCYEVMYLFDLQANFRTHIVINKMELLHSENILFYSYEPEIADPEYYKVAYIHIENIDINGMVNDNSTTHNFGTFAIHQEKSLVYLGGRDGIFTYDLSKKLAWYSSLGDEILTLFFSNNLYIVKSNDSRIIVKKGDTFNSVLEYIPIKNFVINKDNVIVFLSTFGLFLNKREETHWLSKNAFFRGLTVDLDGVVYTWWIDGIYKVDIMRNLGESKVVKVAHMNHISGMTFDNENNILVSFGKALYKMSVTNATLC
ncbi:ommochrome-binding protein-like isoform X1 [Ostrinia furnacalis]|uniref:ommochrome-binding protein-like isoform X1 n=2 Tax=Ostrinia furnacalis TaxID=93504 RepID=UPI00103A4E1D|nr:ommochrome-binding protein-like isoform X1 [Ostrinia furnacalis]